MRYLLLIFIFFICHAIYLTYNMYVTKYASTTDILGISCSNYWVFTLLAVLIATPILTLANYFFAIGFHLAYKSAGHIWFVFILFILAQVLASLVTSYAYFHELPSKGNLVGFIMAIIGLFISLSWK